MNVDELQKALEPFEYGTHVTVKLMAEGGGFIELPINAVEYVPATEDDYAYLRIVPYQGPTK